MYADIKLFFTRSFRVVTLDHIFSLCKISHHIWSAFSNSLRVNRVLYWVQRTDYRTHETIRNHWLKQYTVWCKDQCGKFVSALVCGGEQKERDFLGDLSETWEVFEALSNRDQERNYYRKPLSKKCINKQDAPLPVWLNIIE